jgi:hypothetical protein
LSVEKTVHQKRLSRCAAVLDVLERSCIQPLATFLSATAFMQ